MKTFIRKYLTKLLGLTELQKELENTKRDLHNTKVSLNFARTDLEAYKSILNVGVDIHTHTGENWAVICVAGKPDYVKFISLKQKDIGEVSRFLRRFEERNIKLDSPMGFIPKKRIIRGF